MQHISDWNELRDKIHANAVEHGFWENNPSPEHFMCLVISELMESVEAHRKDRRTDQSLLAHFKDPGEYQPGRTGFTGYFEMYVKDTVEDELAESMGINIAWHIEKKMIYNASRSYKHGKNY